MNSNKNSFLDAKIKAAFEQLMPKMSKKVLSEKFFFAVYTRNVDIIYECLDKEIDPNCRSPEYGISPLHILAQRDDIVVGKRLLDFSLTNPNIRSVHGWTPLHMATQLNRPLFVKLLLENKASINALDRFGKTALFIAIQRQLIEVVCILLKFEAETNIIDDFQSTPLYVSIVDVSNIKIARILFEFGANFNLESRRSLHIFFGRYPNDCYT